MTVLAELDWAGVRELYDRRFEAHRRLLRLLDAGDARSFARLLLGVGDPIGNYSAAEHGLGAKVLASNGNDVEARIMKLGSSLRTLPSARTVPQVIRAASLKYLWIAVGSEASCLLNPEVCWVANTRTIWAHLVLKHKDDIARADEELRLYRDEDASSEMAYRIWQEIHRSLGRELTLLAERGSAMAVDEGVEPGKSPYLWADAIASELYQRHHG